MKQRVYYLRLSGRWISLFCAVVLGALLSIPASSVWASEAVDAGYRTPLADGVCLNSPTGEKPESKLWFNDGYWWGSLCNSSGQAHRIYRLDLATQDWIETPTVLDNRPGTKGDILWDASSQKLYAVYHVFTNSGQATSSNWGRLYRYSYNASNKSYSLDTGFPVDVTRGKSETLVLDKDSTGTLWVTYVQSGKVMINHSRNGNDADWGVPYVLPVTGANNTTSDDISSLINFGDRIGVMWSNQSTDTMYFATHLDSEPNDQVWESIDAYNPGGNAADDHINLKSLQADSAGRVFAVTKTSFSTSTQPLIVLLVCSVLPCTNSGDWEAYTVYQERQDDTRPILLIDTDNRNLHVFTTGSGPGGEIRHKVSSMDNIAFPSGEGDIFIKNTGDDDLNNATSTKQNVNRTTGIVVMASSGVNNSYYHNYINLSNEPPPTLPRINSFSPTSGLAGTEVTLTGSNFNGATAVTFNGTAASFVVDSATQIRATVPAGATSGPIQVTTPAGNGMSATSFSVTQPVVNQAPSVQAGADQTVALANGATLDGTVNDDGLPASGTLTSRWSKVSGAGDVAFANETAADTTATFTAAGVYVLRLEASDGELNAFDDVTITVSDQAPTTGDVIFVSVASGARLGSLRVADEDILTYETSTAIWTVYFDGSDVGLSAGDVHAFELLADGSLLLGFNTQVTVSGLGTVDPTDLVRFIPTSLGPNTAGTFEVYFDGSDVGLDNLTAEAIDALALTPAGNLLLSFAGNPSVPGVSGRDEDLLQFVPSQLGASSSGTFSLYFDGSDVELDDNGNEDIWGAWLEPNNRDIYLSAKGAFTVPGLSGDGADIFICTPGSIGDATSCAFRLFWDGSANGLAGEVIDGFSIEQGDQELSATLAGLHSAVDQGPDVPDVEDGFIDPDDTYLDRDHQIFLPSIQGNE